jgi:2-polyprenyl-3-methyl-5-hydroxy-6-metoxy-1,4-benzoquinol methylase
MTGAARYDAIADFYADAVGDELDDSVARTVFAFVGPVRGKRVLDLACGQGRVSRELRRHGASVTGVDLSSALIARARVAEAEHALGIEYREADATLPGALGDRPFDGVVCHFGLSDIDDLDGTLANVSAVLAPGGWFVFSIVHPCFPGWGPTAPSSWPPGRGYYAEGWWLADNPGFRGKVGANHRTLATYLNLLAERGLVVERVDEPEPSGDWVAAKGEGELVPVFLVVRCRRG